MKWIELIRLLTAQKDVQMMQNAIQAPLDTLRSMPSLERTLAMVHAVYGTDFAVVLVWHNEREPVKTREGLLLADCLRQFGMVDHAAWRILRHVAGPASDIATIISTAKTHNGDDKKERPL